MEKDNGIPGKIPFIQKEDDAAFLWAYLMATQGEDLRKGGMYSKRALELRGLACRQAMARHGRKFEWCLMRYGYLSWPLRKIMEEYKARRQNGRPWGFSGCVVCDSCHCGTNSTPFEEIEAQRDKYDGMYICKSCEKAAHKIAEAPYGEITAMNGRRALVAEDGVYHDEGMRTPGTGMLGFGGRWYLLLITEKGVPDGFENVKRIDPDTGERKPYTIKQTRVSLTNNLFVDRSLHEKLHPIFAGKVNTHIIPLELSQLQGLRSILDSRDWFEEAGK